MKSSNGYSHFDFAQGGRGPYHYVEAAVDWGSLISFFMMYVLFHQTYLQDGRVQFTFGNEEQAYQLQGIVVDVI